MDADVRVPEAANVVAVVVAVVNVAEAAAEVGTEIVVVVVAEIGIETGIGIGIGIDGASQGPWLPALHCHVTIHTDYRRIQPENRVDLGTSGIEIRNRLG